jgi:hypothetical protein
VVATEQSREAQEKSGFPGAWLADESDDLATLDIKIDFAKSRNRGRPPAWTGEIGFGEPSNTQRPHRKSPT